MEGKTEYRNVLRDHEIGVIMDSIGKSGKNVVLNFGISSTDAMNLLGLFEQFDKLQDGLKIKGR